MLSTLLKLSSRIVYLVMRLLRGMIALQICEDPTLQCLEANSTDAQQRLIFACWHRQMLFMPFYFIGRSVCVLRGTHWSAQLAGGVLQRFGFESVIGCTSRGGLRGLCELLRACRRGVNVAITPDGDKGPRFRAHRGVIELARLSGAAIVPMSFAATRAVSLMTWDRLLIPLPFSKAVIMVGAPIFVPNPSTPATRVELARDLTHALNRLTRDADRFLCD
jgi:lysophospholipid acyltransferase (LPLAT)-like uncharacterized protein